MTEGPYKLPNSWRWVRLGEVCAINPRRPQIKRKLDEPTTFVPMMAVDEESGTIVSAEIRPFKQVKKGYTYFEEGDVLFAKITPCMENGKSAIARDLSGGIGFGSTEFHVLRPKEFVIPEWIWFFIRQRSFRERAREAFRGGVGQQRVPQKFLDDYLISLPPLSEQKRIVAKIQDLLSRLREAKRLRNEAQEEAERLWQSVLADTFPKPGTKLPEGWKWVKMGEVAYRESKTIKPAEEPTKIFRYLGMEHVDAGQWEEPIYVEVEGAMIKSQALVFYPGMVLYGKLRPYLNKVVIPTAEGVASTEFVPILPHNNILIPEYLGAYLRSPYFVSYANRNTAGSRQPRLQLEALWGALIPLAPLPDQKRILMYLESLQKKIKTLRQSQFQVNTEIELLENSILEKAFRGDL